jgi:hypothetical protein
MNLSLISKSLSPMAASVTIWEKLAQILGAISMERLRALSILSRTLVVLPLELASASS